MILQLQQILYTSGRPLMTGLLHHTCPSHNIASVAKRAHERDDHCPIAHSIKVQAHGVFCSEQGRSLVVSLLPGNPPWQSDSVLC